MVNLGRVWDIWKLIRHMRAPQFAPYRGRRGCERKALSKAEVSELWPLGQIQPSVHVVNKVLLELRLDHPLCIFYGSFWAIAADWSSCTTTEWLAKPQIIMYGSPQKKISQPHTKLWALRSICITDGASRCCWHDFCLIFRYTYVQLSVNSFRTRYQSPMVSILGRDHYTQSSIPISTAHPWAKSLPLQLGIDTVTLQLQSQRKQRKLLIPVPHCHPTDCLEFQVE